MCSASKWDYSFIFSFLRVVWKRLNHIFSHNLCNQALCIYQIHMYITFIPDARARSFYSSHIILVNKCQRYCQKNVSKAALKLMPELMITWRNEPHECILRGSIMILVTVLLTCLDGRKKGINTSKLTELQSRVNKPLERKVFFWNTWVVCYVYSQYYSNNNLQERR